MKTFLRWLAVLPAAIGSYILACAALAIFNYVTHLLYEGAWTSGMLEVVQSVVGTGCCIRYGAKTAPNYRFMVAIALSVILTGFCVIGYTIIIEKGYWKGWELFFQTFCALVSIVSAFVTCHFVRTDELENAPRLAPPDVKEKELNIVGV